VERDEKMNDLSMSNPKTKITVWSLVFILIAGAFYWYLIKPQFESVKQLENQIRKQQQKLATLQLARQREKVILAENEKMKEQISELKNILPTERNEFLFSEEFQTMAKLCGVTLNNLQFSGKRTKGAPSNTVPFTAQVSANKLYNITYFFIHLAEFPQIINLDMLTISKGSSRTGGYSPPGKNPNYSVNVSGVIYLSQRK
jgi:Tfp pilus assembly protein PilO